MLKETLSISVVLFFTSITCFGADVNVCATLANVVSIAQDRFDQAEIAVNDISAICAGDSDPTNCKLDIENEFANAKLQLEKSKSDYVKAGCDVPAKDRFAKCEARDRLDRVYDFQMNVDAGTIKTTATDGSQKVSYSDTKKCGLNVGSAVCSETIVHNLDEPGQTHFAVEFKAICKSKAGKIRKELNGSAEINRSGDGLGSFVCGALPSNELQLSNCVVQ